MPLYLFFTMVQKSQKWPKTQIKGVLPVDPRRSPVTDERTETTFRLYQCKHFQKKGNTSEFVTFTSHITHNCLLK